MKKILSLLAIIAILTSCKKENTPQPTSTPTTQSTTTNNNGKFIGVWHSSNFGGGSHTLTITDGGSSDKILLYGSAIATVTGSSFESLPYNGGVISTGALTNSTTMNYSQAIGGTSVQGVFTKQ